MGPRATPRRSATAPAHLVRADAWNGLRAGDPVVIDGVRMRGASWEFRAHVTNLHNGSQSVEVVGGRPGDRVVRAFDPHRVYAVKGARRAPGTAATAPSRRVGTARAAVQGELSLADAPQL